MISASRHRARPEYRFGFESLQDCATRLRMRGSRQSLREAIKRQSAHRTARRPATSSIGLSEQATFDSIVKLSAFQPFYFGPTSMFRQLEKQDARTWVLP